MAIVLNGATSGNVTIDAPAIAGTNTITLPASTGTVALTSQVFGGSQTYQDVTSSRALSTTYTNSTGAPIFVNIVITGSANNFGRILLSYNGAAAVTVGFWYNASSTAGGFAGFIIPNGATYAVTTVVSGGGGSASLSTWTELR
jgi:hypothetical protein